jgi:hypothetical protein
VYDFKAAFDPFINKRIKGAQLPFMFKFELVEEIATMQYKLFLPFFTWLPKPPSLVFIEDGQLPEVAMIARDPFEWCMGNTSWSIVKRSARSICIDCKKRRSFH